MALYWSFVLRARLALGRWPTFSNPDPKDLEFTIHHWAWLWSLLGQLAAAPALVFLCLVGWLRWPRDRWKISALVVLYGGFLVGSITMSRVDLGGFSEWMMD